MRTFVLQWLLLAACTNSTDVAPDGERPDADYVYMVVQDAWGVLPLHCRDAWESVAVGYAPREQVNTACAGDAELQPGTSVWGCLVGNTILIQDGLPYSPTADTLAHEWVHFLARECDGDQDAEHSRGELWDGNGVWYSAIAGL